MLSINDLIYFQTVSRTGSFTKAAKLLNTSQSNLTYSITKTEKAIDIKLINRTTRELSLTEFGYIFSEQSDKIIDAYNQLLLYIDNYDERKEMNRAVIGVIPPVARMSFFKKLSSSDKASYYSFDEGNSSVLIEKILGSSLLAALCTPSEYDLSNQILCHELIYEDDIMVILSPCHSLSTQKEFCLSELQNEKIIMPQKETGAYPLIQNAFLHVGINPIPFRECSQIDIVMDMIENNLGVSFLSSAVVHMYQHRNIVSIPLKQKIKKPVYLTCLNRNKSSRQFTTLLNLIRE